MNDMAELAEEVAALAEQVAAYKDAVAETTAALGHTGDAPDDLRDAVGQIVERLLRGRDLDSSDLTGAAEVVRVLVIYAHVGAWFMQGITRSPIAGRVAPSELIAMFNAGPPQWETLRGLLLNADCKDDERAAEVKQWLAGWFTLFDKNASHEPH